MNAFRPIRVTALIVVLVSGSVLAGCAGTASSLTAKPSFDRQHDRDYMAAVESGARGKGVRVVWVNPPYEHGKRYGY